MPNNMENGQTTRRTILAGCTALAVVSAAVSVHPFASRLRVLFIDGDTNFRTVLARHLRAWGLLVNEAEDADSALERLRAAPGGYDVVLAELVLSTMTSIDVLKIAGRDALGKAKPLIMTGYAQRGLAAMLDEVDAGYLGRPLTLAQLRACLTELFGAERVGLR
jgi:CheY-like chemotaxis protein